MKEDSTPTKKQKKFFKHLYKLCREYHVNITMNGEWEFYDKTDPITPEAIYTNLDLTAAYKINTECAALTVEYVVKPADVISVSVMGDGSIK